MANGRQMPAGQMAPNTAAAQQMLTANGINPHTLHPAQLANFANAPPAAQQKSIATYSQNLQQHHGTQMGGKQMPNAVPQGQGSPMMAQGPDGTALNAFYNPGEMGGPGGIRPGPGGPQNGGGSNHALQDYQMQLMLLEQQNKKRLMMARQEQDTVGNGMPREGQPGPGGPPGPNGQFPDTSPQAMRPGASPNPAEQMKRGTPQMNNSGIPSPVPEGGQSRGSPNPAMNFMGNNMDPNMAPHFFKGMEGNMGGQPPMNGGNMRPPSSHPGQPFNGQMTPQMMAAARQQQQQGQPGQGPQGNPQQWQQGPNGQMVPQQMQQQSPQIQNTPQQRSMPPPQAPPAGANGANSRTTASPQQAAAAPPTPSQTNKAAPKKKESKAAKDKVNTSHVLLWVTKTDTSSALLPTRRPTRISTTLAQHLLTTTTILRILPLLRRLFRTPTLPTLTRMDRPMPVKTASKHLDQLTLLLQRPHLLQHHQLPSTTLTR